MLRALIAVTAMLAVSSSSAVLQPEKNVGLSVLYVGNASTPRGKAHADFLSKHFGKVETAERTDFDPQQAEPFDVVILDWSQQDRPANTDKPTSPLGPKVSWKRPTVLLGSAGLLLAEAWDIVGTIG